jgi:ATP-binding cassette subfamily F protein 3
VGWLQRFLRVHDGTVVLISHDRYLLRTLTGTTVEVDANTATRYNGDLDFYLREREIRHANLLAAKENQDRRRDQLERFVERFKATSSKSTQAQSRMKMIERLDDEAIVLPKRSLAAGFLRLAPAPHAGLKSCGWNRFSFRTTVNATCCMMWTFRSRAATRSRSWGLQWHGQRPRSCASWLACAPPRQACACSAIR